MKRNLDAINIYYKNYLAEIGGIETMTYNLALKYSSKKDILFLIKDAHPNQLKRLQKVAKVEKYNENKEYYCKKLFVTYENYVPNNIHADIRARVSHGDLLEIIKNGWKLPIDETIDEDYGVSINTCESVKKVIGKTAILCPNPILQEQPKSLLKLISPQRMTWEKGKGRIIELAKQLDQKEIPYQWLVFCNNEQDVKKLNNPNIIWIKSRLDIKPFIKDADYLVLLSDCEGSPMSVQEALVLGTPIIVTDLPCYKGLDIKDCGFFLNKDLSNLDVDEIYKKKGTFKFKYTPPKDIWGDILLDGKVERKYIPMQLYKVKATKEAFERNLNIPEANGIPKENDEFIVTEDRLAVLLGKNRFNVAFVKDARQEKTIKSKEDEVTVEQAQAVAKAIKDFAEENNETEKEVIEEMIEESEETNALEEIMNKPKRKKKK